MKMREVLVSELAPGDVIFGRSYPEHRPVTVQLTRLDPPESEYSGDLNDQFLLLGLQEIPDKRSGSGCYLTVLSSRTRILTCVEVWGLDNTPGSRTSAWGPPKIWKCES